MLRCLLAIVALSWGGIAHCQTWLATPAATGAVVATVGRAKVKLPPGEWKMVADKKDKWFEKQVWFQYDGARIRSVFYVGSNTQPWINTYDPTRPGWIAPGMCKRQDVYYMHNLDAANGSYDCMMVNHNTMNVSSNDSPWKEAYEIASTEGGVPRPMISAQFAMVSRTRFDWLGVEIYIDPAAAGFKSSVGNWQDSEWHKAIVTPDRKAFLDKVAAWGESYRKVLYASWE